MFGEIEMRSEISFKPLRKIRGLHSHELVVEQLDSKLNQNRVETFALIHCRW